MSKVYLCSFATNDFKNAQEVLNTSALLNGGVDYVINFNEESISDFIEDNKILFFNKENN